MEVTGYEWPAEFNYTANDSYVTEFEMKSRNQSREMAAIEVADEEQSWGSAYHNFRRFTDYYSAIHGYAASAVCICGIPANMAIIIVLTRPKMAQSSTNQLLIWLAVSDLMTMASFIPIAVKFYVLRNPNWAFPSTKSRVWIGYLIFAINSVVTWHTIAIWLTITLAIFRFLFICYPTRGQELCSRARANLAVGLVFFCCLLFCIPNYFVTEVYKVEIQPPSLVNDTGYGGNRSNATPGVRIEPSSEFIYRSSFYEGASSAAITKPTSRDYTQPTPSQNISGDSDDYNLQQQEPLDYDDANSYYYSVRDAESFALLNHVNFWIQSMLFKLIPCALLTVLTCFLISAMREARRRRCKLKSQGRRDESDRAAEHQRTTAMLLAVVGLFLITEFPQGLLTLLGIFLPTFHDDYYQPLGDIIDIAALLNNSINFLLYCVMSRQFRDTFTEVFLRGCGRCAAANKKPIGNGGVKLMVSRDRKEQNKMVPTIENKEGENML